MPVAPQPARPAARQASLGRRRPGRLRHRCRRCCRYCGILFISISPYLVVVEERGGSGAWWLWPLKATGGQFPRIHFGPAAGIYYSNNAKGTPNATTMWGNIRMQNSMVEVWKILFWHCRCVM